MDWSPILAELPKAVPTLISAIVGGLLVLGGQRLTHRYTRQREHERLLREKAEELIYALTQLPDWVDATITAQLRRADYHTPSPLDRAYTLQVLYFPQLAPHFSTIREALNPGLDPAGHTGPPGPPTFALPREQCRAVVCVAGGGGEDEIAAAAAALPGGSG
jgi:hypothetical protein